MRSLYVSSWFALEVFFKVRAFGGALLAAGDGAVNPRLPETQTATKQLSAPMAVGFISLMAKEETLKLTLCERCFCKFLSDFAKL